MSKSVVRIGRRGKGVDSSGGPGREGLPGHPPALDTRVELIQALIPIGLEAVNELLQQEVCQLAGERYSRQGGLLGYARWGGQRGSVYLADQKVAIAVPRVRDTRRGQEVPLSAYQALQDPRRAQDVSLRKVLKGLSCRDYEPCVDAVAETFGLSRSSLSRRFKRASGKKLAELAERDLSMYDIVALFLDGKTFGDEGFEETLTVHRLGLFKELGRSFKTTNCIENLNSLIANRTGKVDRWRNSEQKHRWLATAILDIEPRLRTVVGYRQLPRLRKALPSSSNRSGKAVA